MQQQVTARRARTTGVDDRRGETALRWATVLFAAAFLFHNADHIRRGVSGLSEAVVGAGGVFTVLSVAAAALVLLRHRLAPLVAVVVGFGGALGVSATHLLPTWSAFSDSFPDGHVDAISWAAVLSEVGALLVFGAAGLYVLLARRTAEA